MRVARSLQVHTRTAREMACTAAERTRRGHPLGSERGWAKRGMGSLLENGRNEAGERAGKRPDHQKSVDHYTKSNSHSWTGLRGADQSSMPQ